MREEEKQTAGENTPLLDIAQDPYTHVMRVVFSRWKPFLLRAMTFDEGETTHFSRFTKQLPISQKVLSQNLRQLEEDGLIERTVLPTTPPQVEYRLTEAGKSLVPLLQEVYRWGWEDMKRKGLPIDTLGEMWHGFREPDEALMEHPYKKTGEKQN
jgi:DNA-binding HxlR family transcriptional regulator